MSPGETICQRSLEVQRHPVPVGHDGDKTTEGSRGRELQPGELQWEQELTHDRTADGPWTMGVAKDGASTPSPGSGGMEGRPADSPDEACPGGPKCPISRLACR
jgi:hypothetical protein